MRGEMSLYQAVQICLRALPDWQRHRVIEPKYPETVTGATMRLANVYWGNSERSDYSETKEPIEEAAGMCMDANEHILEAVIRMVLKDGIEEGATE